MNLASRRPSCNTRDAGELTRPFGAGWPSPRTRPAVVPVQSGLLSVIAGSVPLDKAIAHRPRPGPSGRAITDGSLGPGLATATVDLEAIRMSSKLADAMLPRRLASRTHSWRIGNRRHGNRRSMRIRGMGASFSPTYNCVRALANAGVSGGVSAQYRAEKRRWSWTGGLPDYSSFSEQSRRVQQHAVGLATPSGHKRRAPGKLHRGQFRKLGAPMSGSAPDTRRLTGKRVATHALT